MNFFDDKDLATRFKNKNVPQRERFYYYFLFMVLTELLYLSLVYFPNGSSPNNFDLLSDFGGALFGIVAMLYWYKINSSGDNIEFIDRSICICIPVLIKILVYLMPVFFVGLFLIDEYACDVNSANWLGCDINSDAASLPVFVFTMAANLFFFIRMTMMFKIAAASTKTLQRTA